MSISAPFIHRPVATTLLTVALGLSGAVAYNFLPVAPAAAGRFSVISGNARLPGASPETMASSVATPLERQFGRIAGSNEMTSSSTLGSTSITLAVRSEPQHRRRRARRSGGHQRRARTVARESAAAIRTGARVNPADPPILQLGLTSRHHDARAKCTTSPRPSCSRGSRRCKGVGQVFVGGSSSAGSARGGQSVAAEQSRPGPGRRARRARRRQRESPKGQLSDGTQAWITQHHRSIAESAANTRP